MKGLGGQLHAECVESVTPSPQENSHFSWSTFRGAGQPTDCTSRAPTKDLPAHQACRFSGKTGINWG